jgi:Thioredoxin like C-terminal domain
MAAAPFPRRPISQRDSPTCSPVGTWTPADSAFRVLLDGDPPAADHGIDIDEHGEGSVTGPRLYQLIRQRARVAERGFEITFLDPGVHAYVFTFG